MTDLKPHQRELLRYLVGLNAPADPDLLDGRNLRPLRSRALVAEVDGRIVPTERGREVGRQMSQGRAEGTAHTHGRLSDRQEEVVRHLLRQTGPVPEEHLDGRVLRSLRAQGLVQERAGWISPTDEARTRLSSHMGEQRAARARGTGRSTGRAATIHRASDILEAALPRDAEITIRGVPVYADDVVAAFRRFARDFGEREAQHP